MPFAFGKSDAVRQILIVDRLWPCWLGHDNNLGHVSTIQGWFVITSDVERHRLQELSSGFAVATTVEHRIFKSTWALHETCTKIRSHRTYAMIRFLSLAGLAKFLLTIWPYSCLSERKHQHVSDRHHWSDIKRLLSLLAIRPCPNECRGAVFRLICWCGL